MLVPKNVFTVLETLTDRESSRYALGGIKLERMADGSPVAIVTDGHQLLAYSWVEPSDHPLRPADEEHNSAFEVLISAEALGQVKGWKLDKRALRLNSDLDFVYIPESATLELAPISATDRVANYRIDNGAQDGRFPKWRDAFPPSYTDPDYADRDSVAIVLDPDYVAKLCTATAKLATNDDKRGFALTVPNSPDRAILIRATLAGGHRVASVLMPMARDTEGGRADSGQWAPSNSERDALSIVTDKLATIGQRSIAAEALADRLESLADSVACQTIAEESADGEDVKAAAPYDLHALAELAKECRSRANQLASRLESLAAEKFAIVAARKEFDRIAAELAAKQFEESADSLSMAEVELSADSMAA